MTLKTSRLFPFLDENRVRYEVIHHKLDFSAQRTAADTHTPGIAFAKAVVLKTGDGYVQVVLPAPHKVNFDKARRILGGEPTLATEDEIAEIFPDCEIGAEPPFGNLYDLPVYISPELADDEIITFNAGTHHEVVRMRYQDYARLVKPKGADIAWHR